MNSVTVLTPQVGTIATFSFKHPFELHIQNLLGISHTKIKLEVNSIISMKDVTRLSHRDPFTDVYNVVGLDEIAYKRDLKDDVPLITFLYRDEYNTERLFRVPLTYIQEIEDISSIEYVNRSIVATLPPLPMNFQIEAIFDDLQDFIADRLGVNANVTEVTTSDIIHVSAEEHDMREKIRKNSITVNKSNLAKFLEKDRELTDIRNRLDELGIILGGSDVDDDE